MNRAHAMFRGNKGFTLIEIMIALLVIGILGALAYPSYQSLMRENRRADGIAKMMEIMSRQERFRSLNASYSTGFGNLGYPDNWSVASDGGHYIVQLYPLPPPCPVGNCTGLIALPLSTDQQKDGFLYLRSDGRRLKFVPDSGWQTGWQ